MIQQEFPVWEIVVYSNRVILKIINFIWVTRPDVNVSNKTFYKGFELH